MSRDTAVYIGTWGNPLEWRNVKYDCGGSSHGGYSSIVCFDGLSKYVIYALDSVITINRGSHGEINREINGDALECLKKLKSTGTNQEYIDLEPEGGRLIVEPRNAKDINGWRRLVRDYVACVAKKLLNRDVDVVITGALGKLYWNYQGDPNTIATTLLRNLWASIEELIKGTKNLEIILDVTHGINFMPTISYQVVRYVASLALMKGVDEVTIRVYNAMPGTWKVTNVFTDVMRTVIIPPEPKTKIMKALSYGAIAIIKYLCNDRANIDFIEQASIDYRNKVVRYTSNINDWGLVYEQLAAEILCKQASNRLGELLNWNIKEKLGMVTETIIETELNNMKNRIEEKIRSDRKPLTGKVLYSLLFKDRKVLSEECSCNGEQDVRNFIAHAGISAPCTYIESCGNDYCISFMEEPFKCLEIK